MYQGFQPRYVVVTVVGGVSLLFSQYMKKAKTMKRNIYSCVHLTRTSARQMSLDAICIPTRTTFLWGVSLIEEFGQFNTKLMESSCFDNKSF